MFEVDSYSGLNQKGTINTNTNNHEPENEQVRLDDEGRIVGGSVTAICYHILCATNSDPLILNDDCRLFCTTTGFWAPVEVVLNEMTRIASRRNCNDRLSAIIRYWCDSTPRIIWEDGAYEALLVLVEEGVTRVDSKKGFSLDKYVVETEKKFKDLLNSPNPETDSIQSTSPAQHLLRLGDVDISGLAEQGLTGNVLLQIPAEIVAEQLFIFHLKY